MINVVNKTSQFCSSNKITNKQADTVVETFIEIVNPTFYVFRTFTSNNNTEFTGHEEIAKITATDFYFAKPYRSSDWGLNEHTNGLIKNFT
ncbi:hypothetical protein [Candidatus Enterovibrio escicola]|uniref:hypothetical protein n=1 Tax=Candidatus Enterovibrio escicola TaxID=1927127 RepID=UPI001237A4B6